MPDLKDSILSIAKDGKAINIKELRKLVLLSHQMDKDDKEGKKLFKRSIVALEEENRLTISEDGLVKVQLDYRNKSDAKKKKKRELKDSLSAKTEKVVSSKKRKSVEKSNLSDGDIDEEDGKNHNDDEHGKSDISSKGNPLGITRLFIGNLPFSVDESYLKEFMAPAQLTHIKWITDKETGKFYGSAFVEMRNQKDAAIAVTEKNGMELIGRPIRINYAPAREGDQWPPKNKVETGGETSKTNYSSQAGGTGLKSMSTKPENCYKLFIGNLSYSIDDDSITKFFASVDAEVKTVRWLHHKDSGDFKGCGYVEFWNTEACEKAASLRGKTLLGRPIRIDWAE